MSADKQLILQEFVSDCSVGLTKVFVMKGAMKTAESDFNLSQMQGVVDFIANGGLENPSFINEKEWANNPNKEIKIMVCAWSFFSGMKYGYLAFFYQPLTKKWNIKSFKLNQNLDPRNLAFKGLQGILDIGGDNE